MYHHELPDHDAWIARFKAFRDWVQENSRLPENDPEGGPEDTMRNWLDRQRLAVADSNLSPSLEAILRSVPGAIPRGARRKVAAPTVFPPGNSRLDNLELFYGRHGRLPRFSGTAPGEKNMYKYLNATVRVRYRRNELDAATLYRLSKIPGVFTPRKFTRSGGDTPSQPTARALKLQQADTRMNDLIEFCTTNGRIPRSTGNGKERMLYNYLRRVVRPAYQAGTLDEIAQKRLSAVKGVLTPRKRSARPAEGIAA
ncbi:hypothetical protein [Arthrobacter caoxuetaonis]|uniref:Uncharacterized protein n=1 Tax=Arthrobacter caoxuetaonis TaxID=2886935 RepID=A0A9X1MGZ6_9MICC|nr:hypothetical protein [Arthrobacter caoxuetaonis]MCC3299431.1 hypothetical protein [Arthrobacter caoxuetaonis]USQ59076.1 hypothetical protein NF551_18395 [Arthrobacter caoxuetaonis]